VVYINTCRAFAYFRIRLLHSGNLHQDGYLAIVITNQAGVARGYFSEAMVQAIHKRMSEELEAGGATLRRDLLLRPSSIGR